MKSVRGCFRRACSRTSSSGHSSTSQVFFTGLSGRLTLPRYARRSERSVKMKMSCPQCPILFFLNAFIRPGETNCLQLEGALPRRLECAICIPSSGHNDPSRQAEHSFCVGNSRSVNQSRTETSARSRRLTSNVVCSRDMRISFRQSLPGTVPWDPGQGEGMTNASGWFEEGVKD